MILILKAVRLNPLNQVNELNRADDEWNIAVATCSLNPLNQVNELNPSKTEESFWWDSPVSLNPLNQVNELNMGYRI